MICVILAMFLIHHIGMNRANKDVISEIIGDYLPDTIRSIEKNNATLLGIYISGYVDEDTELLDEGISELSLLDWELEDAINIEHRPFKWWYFDRFKWKLNDLKKKTSLSEADLLYIENILAINQEFIDLYYEIIEEEKIDFHIGYDDETKAILVYKKFIEGAKIIASSERYEEVDDFEVSFETNLNTTETGTTEVFIEPSLSKVEAQILAGDFFQRATGEIPALEFEEDELYYEFEKKRKEQFEKGIYNVSIAKDGKSLSAYLRVKGAGGQYSEDKIDEAAKVYIDQLIPEGYELFEKEIRLDESTLDSVEYRFIYYNGVYYDAMQMIDLEVDNFGYLDGFDQLLAEPMVNIPDIQTVDTIRGAIKGKGLQEVILVRNRDGELEYRAYMERNGAVYTLIYDAMTGKRKEILPKSDLYYNRQVLN
jgi:hypothetical protein